MEDEVQLQSLAKRLINIYNACKWSKTKLHIRKKKTKSRDTPDNQQFEEYTEFETESSSRTLYVYNQNNKKKTKNVNELIPSAVVAQYSGGKQETKTQVLRNNDERYINDQFINVCTCKKCCCDPTKKAVPKQQIDARRSFENRRKSNSKLIIRVTSREIQEASVSTENVVRGCCCPGCTHEKCESFPPTKKKITKEAKSQANLNDEYLSPHGTAFIEIEAVSSSASPHSKPPSETKATSCPNASSCCQCPPQKPVGDACLKSECCKCRPSQSPSPLLSSGCQCQNPSPSVSLCVCDSVANQVCCQSVDTNNSTAVHADKIIIPTCYFNEGDQRTPSGNLSLAVSEEVKNVLLDANSSERQKYGSNDKQMSPGGVIVRSSTPSAKRGHSEDAIKGCNDQNCQCYNKEFHDRMINTSCVVVRSCSTMNKRPDEGGHVPALPANRKCDGICCKCQQNDHHGYPPHNPDAHAQGRRMSPEHRVPQHNPDVRAPNRPMHLEYHVQQPNRPIRQEYPAHPQNPLENSPSPPRPLANPEHIFQGSDQLVRSPSPPVHKEPYGQLPNPLIHPQNPPMPENQVFRYPSKHDIDPLVAGGRPPYNNNAYPLGGEERMVANYSPHAFSSQMNPHMVTPITPVPPNVVPQPLYGGMVPPRQMDFTGALLRSQSTPICCKHLPKGSAGAAGDDKIPGINDDTEAEIYATLQKIEFTLRDEADSHSRNMRCIVDQVCKQAGQIKELKVLVTGVVQDKRAPTCKEVGKKIKKLEKRKEKSSAEQREYDLKMKERRIREGKLEKGSLQQIPSNMCCKCGVKKIRPMGCCGKCCARRCGGCCGRCCKGCCPRCCNCCCAPCEKCCPTCCCGCAKCCDSCWSCKCIPRRKKKCSCSKN